MTKASEKGYVTPHLGAALLQSSLDDANDIAAAQECNLVGDVKKTQYHLSRLGLRNFKRARIFELMKRHELSAARNEARALIGAPPQTREANHE